MKHYRVVQRHFDTGNLLVIQRRRWYFPFWLDLSSGALHLNLASVEKHIKAGCPNRYREYLKEKEAARLEAVRLTKEARKIIKYIDRP